MWLCEDMLFVVPLNGIGCTFLLKGNALIELELPLWMRRSEDIPFKFEWLLAGLTWELAIACYGSYSRLLRCVKLRFDSMAWWIRVGVSAECGGSVLRPPYRLFWFSYPIWLTILSILSMLRRTLLIRTLFYYSIFCTFFHFGWLCRCSISLLSKRWLGFFFRSIRLCGNSSFRFLTIKL